MKKNKSLLIIIFLLIAIGGFVYFKIDNNKYIFKAYLKDNNGEYTLVIKDRDYFSFNEMWKIEETKLDNGHLKVLPWVLDERAKKITKVEIQDNIKLKTLSLWFYNLTNLKEIVGLEKLDTSEIDSMLETFKGCESLEVLDLSSLDTRKVTLTRGMFEGCKNLKTIYVGANWNVENVIDSTNMFEGCVSLVGQNNTKYDDCTIDKFYAKVDTLDSGGYLSKK